MARLWWVSTKHMGLAVYRQTLTDYIAGAILPTRQRTRETRLLLGGGRGYPAARQAPNKEGNEEGMNGGGHGQDAREFLRARLLGRRAELARLGALVQGDRLIDEILADLDEAERQQNGRLVKLCEASRACGYTADHLRVLIRAGKLADYGRPHAPRVRLDELPMKPGHAAPASNPSRTVAHFKAQVAGKRNAIPA